MAKGETREGWVRMIYTITMLRCLRWPSVKDTPLHSRPGGCRSAGCRGCSQRRCPSAKIQPGSPPCSSPSLRFNPSASASPWPPWGRGRVLLDPAQRPGPRRPPRPIFFCSSRPRSLSPKPHPARPRAGAGAAATFGSAFAPRPPAWKSTSELSRHRADASTGTPARRRRGRLKFDFHTGLELGFRAQPLGFHESRAAPATCPR